MSDFYRPIYALGGSSSFYESLVGRIDPELKARWVAKLRSGEYEQGRHVLRTNDGKFCCLGVYCDMMDLPTHETRAVVRTDSGEHENMSILGYGRNEDEGSWATIPKPYAIPFKDALGEFTGVATIFAIYTQPGHHEDSESPRGKGRWEAFTLPLLNDNRFTFNQIADIIDYFL